MPERLSLESLFDIGFPRLKPNEDNELITAGTHFTHSHEASVSLK
jgi:hypothetical protein